MTAPPDATVSGPINRKQIRTILLVEDNPGDARLLREMLNEQGSQTTAVTAVDSMAEAEAHLAVRSADIVLLDLGLPDVQGLEAVRRARAAGPRIPLVVLTGQDDESLAAKALQEGAQDYLIKGEIEPRSLLRALRYAIERQAMDDAIYLEKERAEVTLDCMGDAVVCTDTAGNISFLNLVAEKMTGWTRHDAVGQPTGVVLHMLNANTRAPLPDLMGKATAQDRGLHLPPNSVLVRRDGHEIPIEDSIAPIHNRDGQHIGAVIVFRDVTAARAMALQITHSAEHDFLTGLPNRMLLNDRIGQAITLASRSMQKVAIIFLDLDGFKHINDSLGHAIGDKLLQSVTARLLTCVRASDTVSRQGGDEFVVLLSEIERPEDAAATAKRILRTVALPHTIDQHELFITTSVGLSIYPEDGLDATSLVQNADTAMYQAKENGRQNYQFFMPAMNVRARERQAIEESLRRALERGEFALHYQPKVDLASGALTGAEALIRWTHPTRGLVPPVNFIPVAEDCGLIVPIGQWVLRQACAQAQAWVEAGLPAMTMAVNISAVELRDSNFLGNVFAILRETGLDPRLLELELTESVLMQRAEAAATLLQILRAKGVKIAIDDFGTGYSSLSYLRKFPIDALKIDQSFIRQITNNANDTGLVSAIINIGRSLKLRVVAEGVETRDEMAFLQAAKCDEAQGYYFGRPMQPHLFAEVLTARGPAAAALVARQRLPQQPRRPSVS